MSLNFAAISPHPPIVIPGIGQKEDQIKTAETLAGMYKLNKIFQDAEVETLIVISPHTLIYQDRFNICGMKKLFGSFASFDMPDIILEYNNNLELAHEIYAKNLKSDISAILYNNEGEFFELDHGIMVPLYFLSKNQESVFKVLPIGYSFQDRSKHFIFGQVIGEIIKKYPGRVGVVASGDLSHRLIQGAPGGYSKAGQEFDNKIIQDLKRNRIQDILYYDEDFIENAGECGYRSILILLGILDGLKYLPEILSYEGPFGVGYLVANINLKDNN